MRVFTPGMKVIYGLCGTRVCLLLVFVFAWDSSSGTDALQTTSVPLRHPSKLKPKQLDSSVTIVFKNIDTKNRTAADFARREVRRKILEYLMRKKPTVSSTSRTTAAPSTSIAVVATVATSATRDVTTVPTIPMTTAAALTAAPTTRVVEDTTQILTTVATSAKTTQTTVFVPDNRKRRRRDSEESNCPITEENIIFVENDPETDEDGNLRISFSIDNEDCVDIDLFDISNKLNKTDDGLITIAPVVEIFRRLPLPPATTVALTTMDKVLTTMDKVQLVEAGYQVWLPILLAIFLLLIIFIFVCCWKATHRKRKANDGQKIIPTQDYKPSPSNGHAPPRILDDNYGWLVPYEQFSSEQK